MTRTDVGAVAGFAGGLTQLVRNGYANKSPEAPVAAGMVDYAL